MPTTGIITISDATAPPTVSVTLNDGRNAKLESYVGVIPHKSKNGFQVKKLFIRNAPGTQIGYEVSLTGDAPSFMGMPKSLVLIGNPADTTVAGSLVPTSTGMIGRASIDNSIVVRLRDGPDGQLDARIGSVVRKYNSLDPINCWYVTGICQDKDDNVPLGYVAKLVGERGNTGTGFDLVLMNY
tara:strand:+ start:579 stop:1130 length:552 start_codon:yes stop_codon:yes gene_type:complete